MMVNVVVADDEKLIRQLFISALVKYDDIKVIGQAGTGQQVMNILRDTTPDVLLLDLNMPMMDGWEVLGQIKAESIPVKVVVVSMADDDKVISEVIHAGALSFISKNEDWGEMYDAIKTVAKGEFYISHISELR